jgi:hypothetical protein
MMKTVAVILLIAVTVLAGCSPSKNATTDILTKIDSPTDKPAELAQDVQIVLKRSGGFAGVDESWSIASDGHITTHNGKQSQVSQTTLSEAVNELEKLGFFEMKSSYVPLDTCCDRFTYQLQVTANGKTHTVTALEGAQETPEEFWQALDTVNGLLADVK